MSIGATWYTLFNTPAQFDRGARRRSEPGGHDKGGEVIPPRHVLPAGARSRRGAPSMALLSPPQSSILILALPCALCSVFM